MTGPVVVICARAPPQIGGTGTVMYELLRHFPKESVVLISRAQRKGISKDDRVLNVRTFEIGKVSSFVYVAVYRLVLLPLLVLEMARSLKRVPTKPGSVLVVHPDLDFLLAGIFVSKLMSLPLFVYLHDCIVENATRAFEKTAASIAQRFVFGHAKKVYAMSVPMERYYRDRNLKTEALPHGVDASLIRQVEQRRCQGKPKVGIAGVVYETNGSAIKDLVEAKKASGDSFQICLATSRQSLSFLRRLGIADALDEVHTFPSHSATLDFLSSCDILFVPMSFESPVYKDLLTIFPTKVTDYWLAQRPILVYGPKEYAFVSLAERDGYAKVVSSRGSEGLVRAVEESCGDIAQRVALVRGSRKMIEQHDGTVLAHRLMADLGIPEEA